MSKLATLINELKRRNVVRVAVAYLASAWLIIQIADTVLPRVGFSDAAISNLYLIIAIGFIPALVLAWFFEITPDGLMPDAAAKRIQPDSRTSTRRLDRVIVAVLILALGYFAVDKFVLDPARDVQEIAAATKKAAAKHSWSLTAISRLPFWRLTTCRHWVIRNTCRMASRRNY